MNVSLVAAGSVRERSITCDGNREFVSWKPKSHPWMRSVNIGRDDTCMGDVALLGSLASAGCQLSRVSESRVDGPGQ